MNIQKERQERGAWGEKKVSESLKNACLWNVKFINAGYGTVFDKLVVPPRGGYAIEVKVRKSPTIAHNKASISDNEVRGLNKFMRFVGQDYAYIIGIWKDGEIERAFLIPWKDVFEQVTARIHGSIKMVYFPELKKIKGYWDLSFMRGT